MNTPLEITFKGLDKSRAVEAKIAEKATRLERHFDRMTHCRVVVSAPNKLLHKAKGYEIKIEVGIPDHAPLVIKHEAHAGQAHEALQIAIRDAFDAAERRIAELADKVRGTAKAERGRRRPAPVREE